jgi:hypothetical protein
MRTNAETKVIGHVCMEKEATFPLAGKRMDRSVDVYSRTLLRADAG